MNIETVTERFRNFPDRNLAHHEEDILFYNNIYASTGVLTPRRNRK